MPIKENSAVIPAVLAICVVSLLIAVSLFDHDFSKQETHCNAHVCLDLISVSQISAGLVAVGNPISIGVISVSSFVAIGILPIAPISLGVLPIGIYAMGTIAVSALCTSMLVCYPDGGKRSGLELARAREVRFASGDQLTVLLNKRFGDEKYEASFPVHSRGIVISPFHALAFEKLESNVSTGAIINRDGGLVESAVCSSGPLNWIGTFFWLPAYRSAVALWLRETFLFAWPFLVWPLVENHKGRLKRLCLACALSDFTALVLKAALVAYRVQLNTNDALAMFTLVGLSACVCIGAAGQRGWLRSTALISVSFATSFNYLTILLFIVDAFVE